MTTDRSSLTRVLCLVGAITLVLSGLVSGDAFAAVPGVKVAISTGLNPVRYPDSAYEPQANVFLAVTGSGAVKGQWVSPAGVLLGGAFVVSSSVNFQQTPAAQCGENGVCLISWHETTGNLATPMARLVSYSGGFVSGAFALGPAGSMWEMTQGIAYSAATHEFLVTWMGDYPGITNVWVARVNLSGQLLASLALTGSAGYVRQPSVAYNPTSGEYIVAYEGLTSGNVGYTAVQRFANGAKVGGAITLDTSAAEYISGADYDSLTQSVLVAWSRGTQSIYARAIDVNGAAGGLVTLSSSYGAYDALDLAYNPISQSFLVTTHGSLEDVAIEVSSAYAPSPAFTLTSNGGSGNYNPRLSSSTVSPLWFAVTATSFNALNGQLALSSPNAGAGGVPAGGPVQSSKPLVSSSDFDGDAKTDISIYRTGQWWVIDSSSGAGSLVASFGGDPSDIPVPADYDGDRKTDIAVFRLSTGMWYITNSSTGTARAQSWGGDPGDIPVPGDYDGDGKSDIAVYRRGQWWVISSSTGAGSLLTTFGGDPSDIPVPADYDGDGKTDVAVFRRSTGMWYIILSSTGATRSQSWGGDPSDVPVPGDYDGDGKSDIAVFRRSTGAWYVINSSNGVGWSQSFGGDPSDIPVPGDYDGDRKTDIAVFRVSTGNWYILNRSTWTIRVQPWGGGPSDIPIAN